MDALKSLEEISLKNEAIFSKFFKKPPASNSYYSLTNNNGHINPIDDMGSDGSIQYNVEGGLKLFPWLFNATFSAEFIYFKNKKVWFRGRWENGIFEGERFMEGSQFVSGKFKGGIYEAENDGYEAAPDSFLSGTWENYEHGILGRELYTKPIINTEESVELVSVPTGWFVTLIGEQNAKVTFKIIKKIDDKNTDFIFQIYPNLHSLQIAWETIRANYLNNGYIIKGKSFELLGNQYKINKVNSIVVSNEQPEERISAKNIIDFSVDSNLKNFLSYKKIPISIEVDSSSQIGKDFVEQFKKDLPRGVFSDVLKQMQNYVAAGIITGFVDKDFVGLAPVFNNTIGDKGKNEKIIKDEKIMDLMLYLNNFMLYIAKESKDIDKSELMTESVLKINNVIIKKIKQILKIDKFIKVPEKDFINQAGEVSGEIEDKKEKHLKNVINALKL